MIRSKVPEDDTRFKLRALREAKEKLVAGLEEWQMVERYMVTFSETKISLEDEKEWAATVEEVAELSEVREHIGSIESVIGNAEMYLARLSIAAININDQ